MGCEVRPPIPIEGAAADTCASASSDAEAVNVLLQNVRKTYVMKHPHQRNILNETLMVLAVKSQLRNAAMG